MEYGDDATTEMETTIQPSIKAHSDVVSTTKTMVTLRMVQILHYRWNMFLLWNLVYHPQRKKAHLCPHPCWRHLFRYSH
jgi:hypothetical protein